ncbi:hypothetical protein NX862_01570 [Rhodobacter sp. KR11]|uniref:hypothetical protein n=1 Tax=Rhodobacter sp. KR11 TaxID=2974588 RepID=UPI002222B87E|nr:hypothetical protein [Rhodobacter sp. KR11]MCW1917434.1 hypothetical protein [Rhodobacter sp. KR11]
MSVFAAEFPTRPDIDKAHFIALTVAWVQGMKSTTLDFRGNEFENYGDEAVVLGRNGEKLTVKEIDVGQSYIIGARHDLLDQEGRNWRTECVLTKTGPDASLRVRVQCLSSNPDAPVLNPKRPFFIKACLQDRWGGVDGPFTVGDGAIPAPEDHAFGARVLTGDSEAFLPVVYVSACDDGSFVVNPEKLAYDLGGLAHVVVEPSREYSFQMRELCGESNPYGGTIGVVLPKLGVVRRFWLGGFYTDPRSVELALRSYVQRLVSARAVSLGYEWQELQAHFAKRLRVARAIQVPQGKNFEKSYIEALEQEVAAKDETIANLQERLEQLPSDAVLVGMGDGIIPDGLAAQLGVELYPGEFSDRVRAVLSLASATDALAIDPRTAQLLERLLKASGVSGRHSAIIQALKAASKKDDRAVSEILDVLRGLGYVVTKDGKHFKATPKEELFGLAPITVVNTPSDWRSVKNTVSQISELIGLTTIKRGK